MIISFIFFFSITAFTLYLLNLLSYSFLINICINFFLNISLIFILNLDFILIFSYALLINVFFAFLFSGLSHSVSLKMLYYIAENDDVNFENLKSKVVIPSFEYRYRNLLKKKLIFEYEDKNFKDKVKLNFKKLYLINFLILIRKILNIKIYG